MTTRIPRLMLMLLVLVASLGFILAPADAAKVHMNDGRVLEGEILEEGDGYLFILVKIGTVETKQFVQMNDVKRIERDAIDHPADKTMDDAEEESTETPFIDDGATKVAFITLEEMVGPYFNAASLLESYERIKELPEEQHPDIVILDIRSGGGALFELYKLHDVIENELKSEVRTVAWIRWAISAAAMTAWSCDEIYMRSEAAIGGCTAYMSTPQGAKAMEGRELNDLLKYMADLSSRTDRDPAIMRAMQIREPLSADIDPETGEVTWHQSKKGENLVNPSDEVLTLNSRDAENFGVSLGTAETRDELMKMLGCHEWVEVGQVGDEYQQEFRENVKQGEIRLSELKHKFDTELALAGAQGNRDDRNKHLGKARRILRTMQAFIKTRAPSLGTYQYTPQWFEYHYDRLDNMTNPGGL